MPPSISKFSFFVVAALLLVAGLALYVYAPVVASALVFLVCGRMRSARSAPTP